MSKFRVTQPIVYIPSFREFQLGGSEFLAYLKLYNLAVPCGLLDSIYYYTDAEGWAEVLTNLVFKSNLYKSEKWDRVNYALKAMMIVQERYGLNAFGVAIGNVSGGRRIFDLLSDGDGFWVFEPNEGFGYAGAFPLGLNQYKPELVIV